MGGGRSAREPRSGCVFRDAHDAGNNCGANGIGCSGKGFPVDIVRAANAGRELDEYVRFRKYRYGSTNRIGGVGAFGRARTAEYQTDRDGGESGDISDDEDEIAFRFDDA